MSLSRACAAHMVGEVLKGYPLSSDFPWQFALEEDRAFIKALCMQTLRYLPRLEIYLSHLLEKPIPQKEHDLKALLLLGLCQLDILEIPPHAAISETVNACVNLKKTWAKKLVNAILRRFQREQIQLRKRSENQLSGKYAHPDWWISKIKTQYPNDWENILIENNIQAPLFLRVNLQKTSRENYLSLLEEKNIHASFFSENPCGLILENSLSVSKLPFFEEGWVSIQDGAAQLAQTCLQLEAGMRVLDACAAPGGKLLHILESGTEFEKVVALDQSEMRLTKLKQNCERLRLFPCEFHACDASLLSTWWDGKAFDRILLDAPCTGSGIVRRHPDIKIRKQAQDIQACHQTQMALLQALFCTLKPGGLLVYSTCSIFQEENELLIRDFLSHEKSAKTEPLHWDFGLKQEHGLQILPGTLEMDGFYYSCLRKYSL